MSSVLLSGLTIAAGVFAVALGVVHVSIPRLVGYRAALGVDLGDLGAPLPSIGTLGGRRSGYGVRRTDLLGIAWIMSNAASYVLITIGIVDLAWASGWRGVPLGIGAAWIAGWWAIRSASQFALGRRPGDVLVAVGLAALAAGHVVLALGPG